MAQQFAEWIPKHIRPQIGKYTSVNAALEHRVGDCEEMSGVFVACAGRWAFPPGWCGAQSQLGRVLSRGCRRPGALDSRHTACYFWFGWTGAHELVIQKGDRVQVAEQHKRVRLLEDWMQWQGRKPRSKYVAEFKPEPPAEGQDPGPGHRIKDATGEWKLVGDHPEDRYLRR